MYYYFLISVDSSVKTTKGAIIQELIPSKSLQIWDVRKLPQK